MTSTIQEKLIKESLEIEKLWKGQQLKKQKVIKEKIKKPSSIIILNNIT